MKVFTLKKKERLKGHKKIKQLFEQPKTVSNKSIKLLYQIGNDAEEEGIKLGVSVAKRKFKKSPDRNKIKRLLREAYRKQNTEVKAVLKNKQLLLIMMIYIADGMPTYIEVEYAVKSALDNLVFKLNH